MADEILYSSIGDLTVSAALNARVWELVHDPTDLRGICYKVEGSSFGAASTATKVGQVQPAYAMSAPGEYTAAANTALTDSSFTLTAAARQLKFTESDLAALTSDGRVDPEKLAEFCARSVGYTATDLICTAGATATTNVGGGGGVDATVDDLYDAIYALRAANVPGPYFAVFAHNSWNEIVASLRGETGALQFVPATAEMLALRGPGFQGTLLGVGIFSVDSVIEDTSVNQNFAMGLGAIAYKEDDISSWARRVGAANVDVMMPGAATYITTTYEPTTRALQIIVNYYGAFAVAEQARLVGITTDDA